MASKIKRQPVDPRIPRSNKLLQVTFHALNYKRSWYYG